MRRWLFILAVTLGISLRIWLALTTQGNFDAQSYQIVANIMARGGNIYAETARYNYSPAWFHVLDALARTDGMPLIVAVRLFLTGVDVGNIALIHHIAGRYTGHGYAAAVLYALNPGVIAIIGVHGQFEALALFPFLVGLALLFQKRQKSAWICFTIALVIKHNIIFILWALLVLTIGVRRALLWTFASGVVWLLTFTHHAPDGMNGILHNVLLYQSVGGSFGLSSILTPGLSKLLFFLSVVICPILLRYFGRFSFARSSG
jgi:hypothetical protein